MWLWQIQFINPATQVDIQAFADKFLEVISEYYRNRAIDLIERPVEESLQKTISSFNNPATARFSSARRDQVHVSLYRIMVEDRTGYPRHAQSTKKHGLSTWINFQCLEYCGS